MILDSNETKQRILHEFLKICPFDGWSKEALLKAMQNCGVGENFLNLIFENERLSLAEFYIESQNEEAIKKIEKIENFYSKKIRDKIRLALYARFEVESENKIALQRLINFYLNPKNFTSFEMGPKPILEGLKACFKISDSIWSAINDQSTDFNFYTKRLTLAKIIFRSIAVFLKDETNNLEKTKIFIDAEIEKVMLFEKNKAKLKKVSAFAKKACGEFFLDEKGSPKSPKEIVKNLPFFRLIKF
jgi:ubiquinone biosynthesis protein COQ9